MTPLIITLATTALNNEAGRARQVAGQLAAKDGRPAPRASPTAAP